MMIPTIKMMMNSVMTVAVPVRNVQQQKQQQQQQHVNVSNTFLTIAQSFIELVEKIH